MKKVKQYRNSVEVIREFGPQKIESDKSKKEGKGLARLMFEDPNYIFNCDRKSFYLKALLKRGENLTPRKLCPHCEVNYVKYFVINDQNVDCLNPRNASCSHKTLKRGCGLKMVSGTIPSLAYADEFEFSFSTLRKLQNKYWMNSKDFEKVVKLFIWAFGLDELTNESAYRLFKGRRS